MYQKYTSLWRNFINFFNDSRILISIKYFRVFNWAADKDKCNVSVCVCWNCSCNAAFQIICIYILV